MKGIENDKTHREHNFLKILGTTLLALVMLVSVAGAAPSANITFVTTGSSFSPVITVTGNPTIQWVFGDGSTSNSASPIVNFGSKATRENTLVVTPWSAVTKINIGYDGSDGGVSPSSSTIANLAEQNVIAVGGLENVAPYLQVWASNYNPITELDFSNFTALHTIECFSCRSLATIRLRNVPSLNRLCIEQSNISYLDLSEAPSLADLRGASQRSSTYTINWGSTGANIWHICVRDNPQITSTFPFSQFPLLRDFYNWNDNQSGTLHLTSTNLKSVLSANNHYNEALLSGCFPVGRNAVVEIQNNNLISLDISSDPGLLYLNASLNLLNQEAVDGILQTLDSYKTSAGFLDLTGNAAPSIIGTEHANNLSTRGWEVRISSKNNPPIASFTNNVTFGKVPLAVQFNDTSINNPRTWQWDFGDGAYSNEESPKHIYTSPGNYNVTLSVKNANGSDFKVVVITVLEQPGLPVPDFRTNITRGYAPLVVQFTDLSQNLTGRGWDFNNDWQIDSADKAPVYVFTDPGSYNVNLIATNENGTSTKSTTITVLEGSSSGESSGGSHSGSGGGGGTGGGSPEPAKNVKVKELCQVFITSGKNVKFDFTKNATSIVSLNFDSKKTVGKTTTIVEMLKNKSTLTLETPDGEVYNYLNIWIGNGGYGSDEDNLENAVINFRVEKSWVKDRGIDQSSIVLNRYNEKKWNELPTTLSGEDDKYLYFKAEAPGFSPFAITGEGIEKDSVTEIKPEADIKRDNGRTVGNMEQTEESRENTSTSEKKIMSTFGFEITYGIACLFVTSLYRRK